ncbi:MAG: peptidylprolyl isomerase [Ignavibacteriales bacterium]|nr:peptidylprolyl isomerase [Ignavibacteriales bacterium]
MIGSENILLSNDNISRNDTLALIGKKVITSDEFKSKYKEKLVKLGLTDNGETRKNYLINLTEDELLISEAKNKGYNKTEEGVSEHKRLEVQELLNAYSEKHISPNLVITENDLKDLYLKFNTKIKVSHLYAPTKDKADLLYNRLLKGETFADLAKETFADPYLKESGGSLGYISVDEMDPDFEKVAYSLKIGEISKPVKTVEGYSIIRVEDIKQNPFTTENEFLKAHDKIKALVRKRKYEESVKNLTHKLHLDLNIHFNKAFMPRFFEMTRQKSFIDQIEKGISFISQKDLNTPIVNSKEGKWNLRKVIDELKKTKEVQRGWIRSEENLEDFISGLIIRGYIVRNAKTEKLDRTEKFRTNVEYNFDTYLLAKIEEEIKMQIKISPDSIKSFYETNKNLFKTKPEIRLNSILLDKSTLADSIKLLLEKGEPFETLAKKYSIQKQTAVVDGDIGFFRKEELGSLGDKVFSLSIGNWVGPFADDGKYVFLKCTDKKNSTYRSLKEATGDIAKHLSYIELNSKKTSLVELLKKKMQYRLFSEKLNQIKI